MLYTLVESLHNTNVMDSQASRLGTGEASTREMSRASVLSSSLRWADVPVKTNSEIYVSSEGCYHDSPTVQYRGIFLNDEAPALTDWAMVRFTNGTGAPLTGSPFNHYFYTSL